MSTNPNPSPNPGSETCKNIPNLLSSFVTTFVDFSVSGGIFLPNPNPPSPPPQPLQTHYPPQERLIAIGDIHGDLNKCKQSLSLAGLIDAAGNWSGAASTVVQIGDVLDRGDDEIKILYYLDKLKKQADNSGGKFITMNGNHELMNIDCDFRYITRKSLDEFKNWAFWYRVGNSMRKLCGELESNVERDAFYGVPKTFIGIKEEFHEGIRARIAALRPRGPVSTRFFADNVTVLVVGENVFVHGGLLAKHVKYGMERINEEVREWIKGERSVLWKDVDRGRDAVVWLRRFSNEVAESCDCEALEKVLRTIPGAERMVMGHTIQQVGINGACEGKAVRIDVGMSRGCGDGFCEVLEVGKEGGLRVLSSNPGYDVKRGVRSKGRRGLGLLLEDEDEDARKPDQVRA